MTSLVGHNEIRGEVKVIKRERIQVVCPACGQQVEAVVWDGQVKGYCAVGNQFVDFRIETRHVPMDKQPATEPKAEISASTPRRADRDSKGHFVKGNVPWNKRSQSAPVLLA